jgi:hypothetical protein
MKMKDFLYWVLAFDNDVQTIRNNKVAQRAAFRLYGKVTGRLASKLFK